MRQCQGGSRSPERRFGRQVVLYVPVLMVNAVVLGDVEPHQPERAVLAHSREQVRDLRPLASFGTHRGLRQQHRLAGERPHLGNGLAEDAGEGFVRVIVVAVDADPGDVLRTGPPGADRTGAGLVGLQCPQPGDVVGALTAEQRHDVPPSRHERRGRNVPVTPRVPVGVHLVPEADHHRVAEIADAVGKRAQVAVVAARGDQRDRGERRIYLHDRGRAMLADRLGERRLEGFPPAAVIPDEVRLPADRPGEVRDRLVGTGRPALVDAQVRGLVRRQGSASNRRARRRWGRS